MTLKSGITAFLAGLVVLGSTGIAQAACTQADAVGNWKVFAMNDGGQVQRCKVTITSTGLMTNASCNYHFGSQTATVSLTSGSLKLSGGSTCSYSGSFKINGALNTIRELSLARDKITGAGVGTYTTGGFIINMVKI